MITQNEFKELNANINLLIKKTSNVDEIAQFESWQNLNDSNTPLNLIFEDETSIAFKKITEDRKMQLVYKSKQKHTITITCNQIKLEKLANQESKFILIAFLLQLLIFLSTQYFEFSIEGSNRDEKSKKKK